MVPNDDNDIVYFGETDSRNRLVRFGIRNADRSKHMYVIGKTGMGKSTLLENIAVQDIEKGHGMGFLDPHGKTAELLLDYIPKERIKDVVYFSPEDIERPLSFNVMEDVGPDRRHLVVGGLMASFKKIWPDVWSARMEYILTNILLALVEYPGATLLGANRMLADKEFRNKVVANVSDVSVKAFWEQEFAAYNDRLASDAASSIQNKVGQFTGNPLIRNIIGQPKSTFDIRKLMDEGKILVVNLSKGKIGEMNAQLLGSMLITKIYLSAMSRAQVSQAELMALPDFYLFVDEFQSFVSDSFADILSEARKYKLSIAIAHQYIEQMPEDVRNAVFGNVGTTISFRVGPFDAETLEKMYAPTFIAQDLVCLGFAQIYLTLMINGVGSPPFSARSLPPFPAPKQSYKDEIIENSRNIYGRPRAEVEAEIRAWYAPDSPSAPPKPKKQSSVFSSKTKAPPLPKRIMPVAGHPQPRTMTSDFSKEKGKEEVLSLGELVHEADKKRPLRKSAPRMQDKKTQYLLQQTQHQSSLRDAIAVALKNHQKETDKVSTDKNNFNTDTSTSMLEEGATGTHGGSGAVATPVDDEIQAEELKNVMGQ